MTKRPIAVIALGDNEVDQERGGDVSVKAFEAAQYNQEY